jgi:polyisoprenyl-teichoic acid--peptidoglycan teichoic acid transferase
MPSGQLESNPPTRAEAISVRRLIPRGRRGTAWRFLAAAVFVIGATAATTAVAGLLQVNTLVGDLNVGESLKTDQVTLPSPGKPQTILIVGSDHRAGQPYKDAQTDTMLLVRLNAASSTINVLSIPRDLQVTIPGFGTSKINAAYEDGGPGLLIKTIRANVFPNLRVNHIVDVNFGGFAKLVNAIGCVYSDIDHRYYNNTVYTGYSSIDIQPGYQKLCGVQALQFVRFRHTDSDLVRNARQQDFIRWSKDQYGVTRLIDNRDKLLRIFGAHSQTDHGLHTTDGLINLFDLVAFSAGNTIKQYKFPATFEPCNSGPTVAGAATAACYVTASSTAETSIYDKFMTPTPKAKAKKTSANAGKAKKKISKIPTAGLTGNLADGRSQAAQLTKLKMPIYFPRLIKTGSSYCLGLIANCPVGEAAGTNFYPRAYTLHDQQEHPRVAYRMTLALNPVLGQYYGVQGTTWKNPPLLASPSGTRTVAGRKLFLYANGGSVTTVAWHTPYAVYWISNTLTTDISNQQMVGIAASLTRARG